MAVNPLCAKLGELGYDCEHDHAGEAAEHSKAEWLLLAALAQAEETAEQRLQTILTLVEQRYQQVGKIQEALESLDAIVSEIEQDTQLADAPQTGTLEPALAARLEHGLLLQGEKQLAEQVSSLRALEPCGCDDPDCHGFFTAAAAERAGEETRVISLSESLWVQVGGVPERIVYVESR